MHMSVTSHAEAEPPKITGVSMVGSTNPGSGGGAEGDRAPDLCNAIAALSQLSYGPEPFSPPLGGPAAAQDLGEAPRFSKKLHRGPSKSRFDGIPTPPRRRRPHRGHRYRRRRRDLPRRPDSPRHPRRS